MGCGGRGGPRGRQSCQLGAVASYPVLRHSSVFHSHDCPTVLATYIIAAACHPQIEPDESVPGSETLILFRKFALVKSQLLRATCRLKILHLNSVLRN